MFEFNLSIQSDKFVTVEVKILADPEAAFPASVAAVIDPYLRDAIIPGFRKGNAPFEVVFANYKNAIQAKLYQDVLLPLIDKECEKKKVNFFSPPESFSFVELKPRAPIVFNATFEYLPDYSLPDFKEIKAYRISKEASPEYLDLAVSMKIEEYAEKFATFNQNTAPESRLEIGDLALISYSLIHKSQELPKKKGTPKYGKYLLRDSYGNDFSDFPELVPILNAVLGRALSEFPVTIPIMVPVSHKNRSIAGKEILAIVDVPSFERTEFPAIEDLPSYLGFEDAPDLESLKTKLANELRPGLERQNEDINASVLYSDILELIKPPTPQKLIQEAMESYFSLNLLSPERLKSLSPAGLKSYQKNFEEKAFLYATIAARTFAIARKLPAEADVLPNSEEIFEPIQRAYLKSYRAQQGQEKYDALLATLRDSDQDDEERKRIVADIQKFANPYLSNPAYVYFLKNEIGRQKLFQYFLDNITVEEVSRADYDRLVALPRREARDASQRASGSDRAPEGPRGSESDRGHERPHVHEGERAHERERAEDNASAGESHSHEREPDHERDHYRALAPSPDGAPEAKGEN
ncbi:MAG: hypothetical protein LBO66_06995 [Deltaproteobacteria bacterium]|jgi:FKBP-type peptidyl-prolyl cis-trans isomerase (trigger factor)|nr:hypothetical protein [Deltaproteobacteria bacterium]